MAQIYKQEKPSTPMKSLWEVSREGVSSYNGTQNH